MVSNLLIYSYYAVILAIGWLVLKQGLSRKVEFLSIRNIYLAGFVIYQLISPALALKTGNFWFFDIINPSKTGKLYLLLAILFLVVFLFSYHRIGFTAWFARKLSGPPREINDYLLISLAAALVVIAIPLRFFLPPIALAKPMVQVAIAFVGIACAISGWVWSARRSNIPLAILTGLIVAAALVISVSSTFGRRPLIGVVLGFIWGVYYRKTWEVPPIKMLKTMVPLVVCAAVAVSAFTAIRSKATSQLSSAATVKKMQGANIGKGAADIMGGQACGSAALWSLEHWPERMEQRPLFSFKYMGYWYVPRFMWPEKPQPLGNDVANIAKIYGVNRSGITIPPGVIGYARAEGGVYAVVLYALFFGQLFKFFDHLVRLNPTNAYIILPAGCCIGQVVGLARGCIAIFTNLMILGFVATFLILWVVNKLFGDRIRDRYMVPWPQYPMVRQ